MAEEYELIITITTLILLFIIFLVICLSNKTNDIENIFEEECFILNTDLIDVDVKKDKHDFYNISVMKKEKGYDGVIRASTSDKIPYSYPYYVKMTETGKIEKMDLINLNYEDIKGCNQQKGDVLANGIEDPKIFIYKNEEWIAANCLGHVKQKLKCVNQMCIFKVKDPKNTFVLLDPPIDKTKRQKNWTFFENEDGQLLCEYSLSPHIIFKIDTKTGKCIELCRSETKDINDHEITDSKNNKASRFNANPIYLKDKKNYLGIGHVRGESNYLHFFYTFENKNPYKIINISKTFKIETNEKIQFVGGLSEYNDDIYISYGIDDKYNKISKISLNKVLNLVNGINNEEILRFE